MNWKKLILPRSFYDRDPKIVAQDLLGKYLVSTIDGVERVGKIVETEAYLPKNDPAAHGFKGPTERTKSLYKKGGHAYVHTMRQYSLLDVVTEGIGIAGSVLIRALEPIEGIDESSANGPGKIGRAMGITRLQDGIDMTNPRSEIFIADGDSVHPKSIGRSGRIGISKAKDVLLRFYLTGNPHVSKSRP